MGIDTDRVYAFTFALNAAICGAAGVLISMIWVIQPYLRSWHPFNPFAFVIVTAAGLREPAGCHRGGASDSVPPSSIGGFVFGRRAINRRPLCACCFGMLILVPGPDEPLQLQAVQ